MTEEYLNAPSFIQFLERFGLYNTAMSHYLTHSNNCTDRQKWLQRQYKRFNGYVESGSKDHFIIEPFQRSKSRYDKMHFTQWSRSLTTKARRERW
jgi:hypothetical protein